MNKNDLRYRKSHQAIKDTFLYMMQRDGFSNISVKKLIAEADVNRSTFYAHFEDKYSLLRECEDDLLQKMLDVNAGTPIRAVLQSSPLPVDLLKAYFLKVAALFRANGETVCLLMNEPDSRFTAKISAAIQGRWADMGLSAQLQIPEQYAVSIFSGVILSVLTQWVRSGFRETDEEFAEILLHAISYLPVGMFKHSKAISH